MSDGEMVKYEPETQELAVEMRIKVKAPKMIAMKLAEGIKKIITKGWPNCVVSLEEIHMISIADSNLAFRKAAEESESNDDEEE